ncbi:MAG: single-stranded-DNA-specific exonuclease RecJ [Pirellulales bacterium]
MPKTWRIAPHDAAELESLCRAVRVPSLVAQMLIRRGITDASRAASFLNPKLTDLRDPVMLPGVNDAVEIISADIAAKRRIVIYGDYDADGMSGTSILIHCLRLLGANVGYYVPNRLDEGYGLNDKAIDKLAAAGAELLITVDCGVANIDEIAHARRIGLRVIVTDHHTTADRLPEAEAIVHPKLPGCQYPFTGLCGAGVAFKLAWALCQRASNAKHVSPPMREFLLQAVGLAAIGTVADVVPLVDENRVLVHHGLSSLRHRPVLGMRLLMQRTKLDQKPYLSSEDIGFTIAPRMNAAGRLGQAALAVELLTTADQQRADALAVYIDELNKTRDRLERSVYLAANRQALEAVEAGETALVLAGHGWHAGVIGIVAGRLAEKYHRPTLLAALDEAGVKPGLGSARSVPGFDLVEALKSCQQHLVTYGGHAAAAGFRVAENKVDALRADFCELAAELIPESQRAAELHIDGEIPFSGLTLKAIEQLERLAPFGQGNPRPLLCSTDVQLGAAPRTMGGGDRHLSLQLEQHGVRYRAVAFGKGERCDELSAAVGPLSFAFRPVINAFRGQRKVELHVEDWQLPDADQDNLATVTAHANAEASPDR